MKPWLTREEKEKIIIPEDFHQMIIGMLLGDGSLYGGSSFWIEQKDKDFVEHLWKKFSEINLVVKSPQKRTKIDKRLNVNGIQYNDSYTYHFKSCSLPYFKNLYKKWYTISGELSKSGKKKMTKIIPNDLKITPISLAYWIAGDGYFSKRKKDGFLIIHTNSFTLKENKLLSEILLRDCNVNSCLISRNKPSNNGVEYMIKIRRIEMNNLIEIVEKHLFKTFFYKLGIQ